MIKNYTCIACPLGCATTLEKRGDDFVVSGNKCKRGEAYVIEEFTAPKRMVTATMKSNASIRVPVRTDRPLAKDLVNDLLTEIYKMHVNIPVKCGDVLIAKFMGGDVNVIATRSIEA